MNKILSCAYFVIIAAAALAADVPRADHIPDECRPKAWWFFGQTETTHEGITADAEAMKRVGFGGVVYYDQLMLWHGGAGWLRGYLRPGRTQIFSTATGKFAILLSRWRILRDSIPR